MLSFCIILAALVFVVAAARDTTSPVYPLTSRSKIHHYETIIKPTSISLTIPSTPLAYIVTASACDLQVSLHNIKANSSWSVECTWPGRIDDRDICVLWNRDNLSGDSGKDHGDTEIKIVAKPLDAKTGFDLQVVSGDVIELDATNKVGIRMNTASSINAIVRFKDLTVSSKENITRVQFAVVESMKKEATKPEFLKMYIGEGNQFVDPEKVTVKATTQVGIGMVVTLVPTDKEFCANKSCEYSIRIEGSEIDQFRFYTLVKSQLAKVKVPGTITLREKLRGLPDMQIFEISDKEGRAGINWKFLLTPIEGNPDIYVNIGTLPKELKDYKYKSTEDRSEAIFVSKDEFATKNGYKSLPVYVTVVSDKPSDTFLQITSMIDADSIQLTPNVPITRKTKNGNIDTYIFRADISMPEKLEAFVRVSTLSGDPDLYVKDCSKIGEGESCRISQEDIENKYELSTDSSRLFVYSDNKKGDDSYFVKMNCIPATMEYDNFTFPEDQKGVFTTRVCMLAIAVHAKESTTSQSAEYTIELKDAKFHYLIKPKTPTYLSLSANKPRYYKIDMNEIGERDKYINFKFITISGEMKAYLSRSFSFPTSNSAERTFDIASPTTSEDHVKIFTIKGTKTTQLKGDYFLTLDPSKYYYGSVHIYSSEIDGEEANNDGFEELRIGTPALGFGKASKKAMHSYYFHMDVPSGKDAEIVIELTPLKGSFHMCASVTNSQLNNIRDCEFSDMNNEGNIVLRSSDPKFVRNATYGVLVWVDYNPSMENSDYRFSLQATSEDSFTQLFQGIPYKIDSLTSHKYFQFLVDSATTSLAIIVTTDDADTILRVSSKRENLMAKYTQKLKRASGVDAGILLNKEDLKTQCGEDFAQIGCTLFIKLEKQLPSRSESFSYTIMAYDPNKKIYMMDGSLYSLPSPMTSPLLIKFFPTSNDRGALINVYNDYYNMVVNGLFYGKDSSGKTLTRAFVSKDPQTNVIWVPPEMMANRSNIYMEATLFNSEFNGKEVDQLPSHDISKRTYVQVSTGTRQLVANTPFVQPFARKGLFDYFTFKKKVNDEALIYLRVLSGEADLYIKKGTGLPDLNTYDAKSNTIKDDQLFLPKGILPKGQIDSEEIYTVGVYPQENSRYHIQASISNKYHYLQVTPGVLYNTIVSAKTPLIIVYQRLRGEVFSFAAAAANSNIEVAYRTVDESKAENMEGMLPGKGDPSFKTTIPKYLAKMVIKPQKDHQNENQVVFKISTTETDMVSFYISREDSIVQLKTGIEFSDSLLKQTCQTYSFNFDSGITNQTLKVTLDVGAINFFVSTNPNILRQNDGLSKGDSLKATYNSVSRSYEINSLDLKPSNDKQKTKSELIFSTVYVVVCSTETSSQFSLSSTGSSTLYHKIAPSSRLSIDVSSQEALKHSHYFKVNSNDVRKLTVKINLGSKEQTTTREVKAEEIVNLLHFYYISVEDFGYTDSAEKGMNKLPADVNDQKLVEESGLRFVILSFSVQDGYFIIKPKSVDKFIDKISAQLIINNNKLISSLGRTSELIVGNERRTFQLIRPKDPDARMKVIISACQGVVEVFAQDQESSSELFTPKQIGRSIDFNTITKEQFGREIDRKINLEFDVPPTTSILLISVKGIKKENNSLITIDSQLTTLLDPITIEDYFSYYKISHNISEVEKPMNIIYKNKNFIVRIDPIHPAFGFNEKYTEFVSATIDIFVELHDLRTQLFSVSSRCEFDPLAKNSAYRRTSKILVKSVKGELQWPEEPIDLGPIPYPLEDAYPYTVAVQIKIKFEGMFPESDDDDATIIVKNFLELHYYKVTSTGAIVGIVVTLFILIILALIVALARSKLPARLMGRAEYRPTPTLAELPRLDLDESNFHSNKLETDDFSMERKHDPRETIM